MNYIFENCNKEQIWRLDKFFKENILYTKVYYSCFYRLTLTHSPTVKIREWKLPWPLLEKLRIKRCYIKQWEKAHKACKNTDAKESRQELKVKYLLNTKNLFHFIRSRRKMANMRKVIHVWYLPLLYKKNLFPMMMTLAIAFIVYALWTWAFSPHKNLCAYLHTFL